MPEDIQPDPQLEADGQSGDEGESRPEWLPSKFDSPEALAKSYSELERRLTEVGEEKNNYAAQLDDLYGRMQQLEASQSQQPQGPYNPQQDPYLLAYQNAMENGDYQAALGIQMALTQQAVQQNVPQQQAEPQRDYETWAFVADQTAAQLVGNDWGEYKERVAHEARNENFDGLSAQQAGQKLARIYKMVKADDVLNNQQTLAQQKAEAERQAKLQAQTMSGGSGRLPEPTRDEAAVEAIKKAAQSGSYSAFIQNG